MGRLISQIRYKGRLHETAVKAWPMNIVGAFSCQWPQESSHPLGSDTKRLTVVTQCTVNGLPGEGERGRTQCHFQSAFSSRILTPQTQNYLAVFPHLNARAPSPVFIPTTLLDIPLHRCLCPLSIILLAF